MKYLTFIPLAFLFVAVTAHAQSYFYTQPPHSQQPSGGACASWIAATPEKISSNTPYNYTLPTAAQLQAYYNNMFNEIGFAYLRRVDGQYSGSTDMIIRWAACKWGVDENIARAAIWGESAGIQSTVNDWVNQAWKCPPGSGFLGAWNGSSCASSYGIGQIKYTWQTGTWPLSQKSTAYNVDYRFAQWRACMDGQVWNFYGEAPMPGYPTYPNGDTYHMVWGCIGSWFSGDWNSQNSVDYQSYIQQELNDRKWLQ